MTIDHLFDLQVLSLNYEIEFYQSLQPVLENPDSIVVLSSEDIDRFLDPPTFLYEDFYRLIHWMEKEGYLKVISNSNGLKLKFHPSGKKYLDKIKRRYHKLLIECI